MRVLAPAFVEDHDVRLPRGLGGLFYGVYPATVTDLQDPASQGRVKVRLPWAKDADSGGYEVWARVATLMAGNDRGSWFIPDVDDEVLIAFAGGHPNSPYVIGALWNGSDAPPQSMDQSNAIKKLRSRNGVTVTLDDTDGQEQLILETPGGQKITLKEGPATVELTDSNGNTVTLASSGVSVQSSGSVEVQASSVTVNAGSVTVNAGTATFSGTVQANTVIATSIVGSTYTPGAGNVW